jgi:hypothetical protein
MLSWGTAVLGQTMPLKNNDLPPEVQARFAGQPAVRIHMAHIHSFIIEQVYMYIYNHTSIYNTCMLCG